MKMCFGIKISSYATLLILVGQNLIFSRTHAQVFVPLGLKEITEYSIVPDENGEVWNETEGLLQIEDDVRRLLTDCDNETDSFQMVLEGYKSM